MWKPLQRIRYKAEPGAWPSTVEAARSMLFSPLSHQALQLESRTWVPAMVPWRATESGFVTPDNLDWYARFARGCPAALVVEATKRAAWVDSAKTIFIVTSYYVL